MLPLLALPLSLLALHVSASDIRSCLEHAVSQPTVQIAYPESPQYQRNAVHRWNLDVPVSPAAVTFPRSEEEVVAIVRCAASVGLKVQAKSGGHSYGNYALPDGGISIDLKHLQHFELDPATNRARIGAGTKLQDVTRRLHDAGGRAMAHGTCPAVGIGGHATIGGLGPTSRQWGSSLDHVEAVRVVLADGSIVTAGKNFTHEEGSSQTDNESVVNPDLFFALKGAAAGFGIITEFTVRTEPEPANMVQYSFQFTHSSYADMAPTLQKWQELIAAPELTRKLASEVVITELGMVISGTYYGPKEEYEALDIYKEFFDKSGPSQQGKARHHAWVWDDWMGYIGHLADEQMLLWGTGNPTPIFCKSLTFTNTTLMSRDTIDKLLHYLDSNKHKGSPIWYLYFDLEGGAINDVPLDQTAYAHRDALFYMQSYAVGVNLHTVSDNTKAFIRGIADTIRQSMPGADHGVYAGYVDPDLPEGDAQRAYWGRNLARLEQIKAVYDPDDIFHNPQSVRPAKDKESRSGRERDEL